MAELRVTPCKLDIGHGYGAFALIVACRQRDQGSVDDFVDAKALNFNNFQRVSTSDCKRFNQNELKTTKIHNVQ